MLIHRFLQLGVNVLFSDIDAMWMRNPLPFFDRFPEVRPVAVKEAVLG